MRAALLTLLCGCHFISKAQLDGDIFALGGDSAPPDDSTPTDDSPPPDSTPTDDSAPPDDSTPPDDSGPDDSGPDDSGPDDSGDPPCGPSLDPDALHLSGALDETDADGTWVGGAEAAHLGYTLGPLTDLDGDGAVDVGIGGQGELIILDDAPPDDAPLAVFEADGDLALTSAIRVGHLNYLTVEADAVGDTSGDGSDDLALLASGDVSDEYHHGLYLLADPFRAGEDYNVPRMLRDEDIWLVTDPDLPFWTAGGLGDIDGDSFADLGYGASSGDAGRAGVLLGGRVASGTCEGWDGCADLQINLSEDTLGDFLSVAPAGDTDGDGVAELLVGAPEHPGWSGSETDGAVWVVDVASALADGAITLTGDDARYRGDISAIGGYLGGAGYTVAAAGDVDGDGNADVLASAPGGAEPQVVLMLGSGDDVILERTSSEEPGWRLFGELVATGGDLDGDCIDDVVVVGRPYVSVDESYDGAVHIWLGGAYLQDVSTLQSSDAARIPLTADEDVSFWVSATGGSDLDRDGYGDLLIGAFLWDDPSGTDWDGGGVWLHRGGPSE